MTKIVKILEEPFYAEVSPNTFFKQFFYNLRTLIIVHLYASAKSSYFLNFCLLIVCLRRDWNYWIVAHIIVIIPYNTLWFLSVSNYHVVLSSVTSSSTKYAWRLALLAKLKYQMFVGMFEGSNIRARKQKNN